MITLQFKKKIEKECGAPLTLFQYKQILFLSPFHYFNLKVMKWNPWTETVLCLSQKNWKLKWSEAWDYEVGLFSLPFLHL